MEAQMKEAEQQQRRLEERLLEAESENQTLEEQNRRALASLEGQVYFQYVFQSKKHEVSPKYKCLNNVSFFLNR